MTGLTTALLLSRNANLNITVAAKHMPGDYDIEYASPWAGADYLPSVTWLLLRFLPAYVWGTVITTDRFIAFLL